MKFLYSRRTVLGDKVCQWFRVERRALRERSLDWVVSCSLQSDTILLASLIVVGSMFVDGRDKTRSTWTVACGEDDGGRCVRREWMGSLLAWGKLVRGAWCCPVLGMLLVVSSWWWRQTYFGDVAGLGLWYPWFRAEDGHRLQRGRWCDIPGCWIVYKREKNRRFLVRNTRKSEVWAACLL